MHKGNDKEPLTVSQCWELIKKNQELQTKVESLEGILNAIDSQWSEDFRMDLEALNRFRRVKGGNE